MAYQTNLSWPEARALARAGAMVRRIGWLDRWLFASGPLWFILPNAGDRRPVQSTDWTAAEFLATDFTTILVDQFECAFPTQPDPDPQPDPGGPIVQLYEFYIDLPYNTGRRPIGGYPIYGQREIANPFATACNVWLHGVADDHFRLKLPAGSSFIRASVDGSADPNYTDTVDFRFPLPAGATFWIGATNEGGGPCKFSINGEFSL